jgi:hypothetical protein
VAGLASAFYVERISRSVMWFIRRAPPALSLVVALLAGCASEMMKSGTDRLIGQPLSAAIERLGFPTEERTIAGMKVYVWTTSTILEGTQSQCTIRAIMKGDVIGSWDWEGNEGRCSGYAQSLQPLQPGPKCPRDTLLRPCK